MTVSKDPRYAKYFQMVKVVSIWHKNQWVRGSITLNTDQYNLEFPGSNLSLACVRTPLAVVLSGTYWPTLQCIRSNLNLSVWVTGSFSQHSTITKPSHIALLCPGSSNTMMTGRENKMADYLLLLFNETKAKFLTIAVVDCNSGHANSSNCPQNDGRRTGSKFTWVSLEASVWLQVLFIFIYLFGVAFSM